MSDTIAKLSDLVGIEPGYYDIAGQWHETPHETRMTFLRCMGIDASNEAAARDALQHLQGLRAAPREPDPYDLCVVPADQGINRSWGASAQVYSLRSERDGGVGDFNDVAVTAEALAREGADFLGLSPLHALFASDPSRNSPYSPSSRRWLNTLFIAVDEAASEFEIALPPLDARQHDLIDYPEIRLRKRAALDDLWGAFWPEHLTPGAESVLGNAYRTWESEHGDELWRFACFEAISEAQSASTGVYVPFSEWPSDLRSPTSDAVRTFASENEDRLRYHGFLQWLADRQLANAQRRATEAGMRIGLYRDLAVGVTEDGADAWADPHAVIHGASIGAPPDAFSPTGQDWAVAPLSPLALVEHDGAALIKDLQANMRHAGAVRIDHVMGMMRLFWIPRGGTPADGTYVRYPFADMLRHTAGLSREHNCLVVGEDLGTVPEGFRPAMNGAGILSCRVVWFERQEGGAFRSPDEYDPVALATVSTHDLPTVRGFLRGRDIEARREAGQTADPQSAEVDLKARDCDIDLLTSALREANALQHEPDEDELVVALHRFLAKSRCQLAAVQLEDLAGAVEQVNLPGTIEQHPNWRRRLPRAIEQILREPSARRIIEALREERRR